MTHRYLDFGEIRLDIIMEFENKRAEPVLFLLSVSQNHHLHARHLIYYYPLRQPSHSTLNNFEHYPFLQDSTHKNAMLEMPKHHFRDDQLGHGTMNPLDRPGSSLLVHPHDSCAAQALRRPDASSEPSCSARTSLESDSYGFGGGPPTSFERRRSVSFQPEVIPEEVRRSRSRSELLSADVSPFQSYAHLPSDDFSIGLEDHICGPSGYRIGSQGGCLGIDKSATSAPLGVLEKLDITAPSFDCHGLQQSAGPGMQTAAQRLMGPHVSVPSSASNQRSPFENPPLEPRPQVIRVSAPRQRPVRFLSSPLEGAPLVLELANVIPPIVPDSPRTLAAPELHRCGESFGAHLISPRVSGDSASRPPSRCSRSSLELLLGTSRASTPSSRHSLDSVQNMLRLVNNRQSWEVRQIRSKTVYLSEQNIFIHC